MPPLPPQVWLPATSQEWLWAQRYHAPGVGQHSHTPWALQGLPSGLGGPAPLGTCRSGGGRAVREETGLHNPAWQDRQRSEGASACQVDARGGPEQNTEIPLTSGLSPQECQGRDSRSEAFQQYRHVLRQVEILPYDTSLLIYYKGGRKLEYHFCPKEP